MGDEHRARRVGHERGGAEGRETARRIVMRQQASARRRDAERVEEARVDPGQARDPRTGLVTVDRVGDVLDERRDALE